MKKLLVTCLTLVSLINASQDVYQINFIDPLTNEKSSLSAPKNLFDDMNIFLETWIIQDKQDNSILDLTRLPVSKKGIETIIDLATSQKESGFTPSDNEEAIKEKAVKLDQETLAELVIIGSTIGYTAEEILRETLAQKIAQEGEKPETTLLLGYWSLEFIRAKDLDPLIKKYTQTLKTLKKDEQNGHPVNIHTQNIFQELLDRMKNTWNEIVTGLEGN